MLYPRMVSDQDPLLSSTPQGLEPPFCLFGLWAPPLTPLRQGVWPRNPRRPAPALIHSFLCTLTFHSFIHSCVPLHSSPSTHSFLHTLTPPSIIHFCVLSFMLSVLCDHPSGSLHSVPRACSFEYSVPRTHPPPRPLAEVHQSFPSFTQLGIRFSLSLATLGSAHSSLLVGLQGPYKVL